ncbi:hypothetical protein QJS10_CPB14g00231 [Acorus calamus]|uniref:Uncharacterized protein n=1 Tax=Acorus calamus TaxID=4465 RepID=A0AAV9D9K4_ACOCL|nr:hypothetical protein QJS10_CPB14g00231 [Acorus calamus]
MSSSGQTPRDLRRTGFLSESSGVDETCGSSFVDDAQTPMTLGHQGYTNGAWSPRSGVRMVSVRRCKMPIRL